MTWFGTFLSEDQTEVVELVAGVLSVLPAAHDGSEPISAEALGTIKEALVESGVWSIGMSDEVGGGGAPLLLRQTALSALGAERPALAWAIAQAHAASAVLAASARRDLLDAVVAGHRSVAVVERGTNVDVQVNDGRITGRVNRLDSLSDDPIVIVLDGESCAWVIEGDSLSLRADFRRSGFSDARVTSAVIGGAESEVTLLSNLDVAEIRASLHLAGAAIAAGITVAAAESAFAYAEQRVQFGGPLTAIPAVRAELLKQQSEASRALRGALVEEVPRAATAAAVLAHAAEAAIAVTASAVQSHGGYGYLKEYGIERLVRDALSLRAATGASTALSQAAGLLTPGNEGGRR